MVQLSHPYVTTGKTLFRMSGWFPVILLKQPIIVSLVVFWMSGFKYIQCVSNIAFLFSDTTAFDWRDSEPVVSDSVLPTPVGDVLGSLCTFPAPHLESTISLRNLDFFL